jgi:hypothetical protein
VARDDGTSVQTSSEGEGLVSNQSPDDGAREDGTHGVERGVDVDESFKGVGGAGVGGKRSIGDYKHI